VVFRACSAAATSVHEAAMVEEAAGQNLLARMGRVPVCRHRRATVASSLLRMTTLGQACSQMQFPARQHRRR